MQAWAAVLVDEDMFASLAVPISGPTRQVGDVAAHGALDQRRVSLRNLSSEVVEVDEDIIEPVIDVDAAVHLDNDSNNDKDADDHQPCRKGHEEFFTRWEVKSKSKKGMRELVRREPSTVLLLTQY